MPQPQYMINFVDYYKVLNIPETSTSLEIKLAYRKQALQFHPDKNSDADATKKFQQIGEAYEILGNKDERKSYDEYRSGTNGQPVHTVFQETDESCRDDGIRNFWGARRKREEKHQQRKGYNPFSKQESERCYCVKPYKCAVCASEEIMFKNAKKRARKNRY